MEVAEQQWFLVSELSPNEYTHIMTQTCLKTVSADAYLGYGLLYCLFSHKVYILGGFSLDRRMFRTAVSNASCYCLQSTVWKSIEDMKESRGTVCPAGSVATAISLEAVPVTDSFTLLDFQLPLSHDNCPMLSVAKDLHTGRCMCAARHRADPEERRAVQRANELARSSAPRSPLCAY